MDNIEVTNINEADILEIARLAIPSLNSSRYCDSYEQTLDYVRGYIYLELAKVSFVKALKEEGKIIGLVVGRIDSEPKLFDQEDFLSKAKYYYEKAFNSFSLEDNLYNKTCLELKNNTNISYDGELTLLLLDSNYQNRHLGHYLVNLFLDYARALNKTKIYVYTDTDCNYKFYEHIGFNLKGSKNITFDYDNHHDNLTCYIYDVNL